MTNNNVLKKIFPEPLDKDFSKLNFDSEGLWSITHPNDAFLITSKIKSYGWITEDDTIVDMTAGCGGNVISFIHHFNNVTGIEINKNRFNILENNLNQYKLKGNLNLINDDCMNHLNKYDIYFIDPPWGGPKYKSNNNLELYLSEYTIKQVLASIKSKKLIILKVPFNYNYEFIKKEYLLLDEIIIKNIVILFLN